MVPQPWRGSDPGLHDDEVESHRQAIVLGRLQPSPGCGAQPGALPPIDRLLRQPEVTSRSPANLDEDDRRRRARVDGDHVELRPADVDLPAEDGPPRRFEPSRDQPLGVVAGLLLGGPHPPILRGSAYPALTSSGAISSSSVSPISARIAPASSSATRSGESSIASS